jgi:glycosyltransferase involved in cell wall biosynthesis
MSQNSKIAQPDVFVMVPSCNHAPFIERCLRSIIEQTVPPKKLLVIDDGSKDNSVEVIERVLRDCPFESELIVQENRGLCRTLNRGLSMSSSEYFGYLGSDDVWLPEFLERRLEMLMSDPQVSTAYGNAFLIDENDRIIDCTKDWPSYPSAVDLDRLLSGVIPVTAGTIFRRAAIARFGWNDQSILEDYELYLKLAATSKFAFDDRILAAWRQHSYNTSADFSRMLSEWLAAQDRVSDQVGVSGEKLASIQKRLKFTSVASFFRVGEKRAGFRLLRENWSSADGPLELGSTLLRGLIPSPLYIRMRKFRMARQTKRYGKLTIGRGEDPTDQRAS